jgi:RNA-directed DNA polymerase
VHLVRYADDFIISGDSSELLEREVRPVVEAFLRERGLELSPTKTRITRITNGFDFLGQNVRRYANGKLFITPSKDNVKAFLAKVRGIVEANRTATAGNLIAQLNPVIRGWALFHRHVVSAKTYRNVKHAIFQMIWRWARRRHPAKSKTWIADKYFVTQGSRRWVFAGELEGRKGQRQRIQLFDASWMHIRRHIKVRAEANPYDPDWEMYFEQRHDTHMTQELEGQGETLGLWQAQVGICPVCNQKLTKQSGWHKHHIVWRVYGGSDNIDNLVLLHPNCHRQVHSRNLSVVKPGHASG